jgi:energy-coupling factor transporter ATP-binding protein EcfA2
MKLGGVMEVGYIRIRGYQSFSDSNNIAFDFGINLVIGANNVGKSAILRALSQNISEYPHRCPQYFESYQLPKPTIELFLRFSGSDFIEEIQRRGDGVRIPVPTSILRHGIEYAESLLRNGVDICFRVINNAPEASVYPSHGKFKSSTDRFSVEARNQSGTIGFSQIIYSDDTLPQLAYEAFRRTLFYFSAERLSLGESIFAHAEKLEPNAENLPAVLMTMQGSMFDVFQTLTNHLRDIFPTVGNMSVRPHPKHHNKVEVLIWPTKEGNNPALAFPLSQSGTGVGQVIAILVAVMTTKKSIIVIDEINSFLHPAAVKRLLRILQSNYDQHQYIISTHSPEVISFGNPKSLHLVTREGYTSSVKKIDIDDIEELQNLADQLGISMSDVFAANSVIWVEGQTEEICFPYVYEQFYGQLPRDTVFSRVSATGDFSKKNVDPTLIFNVYTRLSTATKNLVQSVIFSFDTEELSDIEKDDLNRRAGGKIIFLPRRMVECYLINPQAIASFINLRIGDDKKVTAEEVEDCLISIVQADSKFNNNWNGSIHNSNWLSQVHGGNLIKSIIRKISNNTVEFSKNRDSLELMKYIAGKNISDLEPLAVYVKSLTDAVKKVD